ncbi:MAG TPA: transketolase C-terminal domain-containing protein [Candidatus Saccharimonadia bacterium]|jgi:transketolase|nr:transketolase C-terminal domain-containing protein [Candidatus Saccharimonadia bacterium]
MIDPQLHLSPDLFSPEIKQEANRMGFGRGLVEAGHTNKNIMALCADLTESTRISEFAKSYPERYIEIGIAEQNLVTVAAGLALAGKTPFVASYSAFSPGRNWEQIRTTICLNDTDVKIVGAHAGVSVGPDGATHQMLEDIALMRVLPNMVVVVPCDAVEAEKATQVIANHRGPAYLRLAREKSPVITTEKTPFSLAKAHVFRKGKDLTIVACGLMVYQALMAAEALAKKGIEAEVINAAVVKPLDADTIVHSARKTGAVLTVEEAQIAGGLGGAVAEALGEQAPVPISRMGMLDRFGESGKPDELLEHFGLTAPHIAARAQALLKRKNA